MASFESAFEQINELVKDFKENESRYLSTQYQEAEVRRDFIDKLFEALGWDVYHRTQKNPYEQEVKVEKGVSVGKAQKRADYAFYISPEYRQPKFFCEAKKPSRSLKNADDYFQTIRYGWNANTPVAVLTDFEEFHILDCRYKPNINQILNNPNHKSYTYTDFTNPEKFKEIYYLFSRNDVANNSLEKYSEGFAKNKGKQKTAFKSTIQAIDDDFLEYIDDVRETLAKAFKKNDSKLSSEELTEATQRTIDRIVFIRFLEDKLIEPEYYISEFGKKGNSWTEFISVCRKLDAKYNGIVFKKHFIDEQNFQGPEQSTFKKICDEMSYLNSPYDFNAIPIHILGSIYERFLGKVVNATAQRVKVEEKPEVRKAGGVYYTPKYIVDYIVHNTVGKLIESKSPKEIAKLRFADIACGSGSFLIGVFETLIKYHTEYYQAHPDEAKKDGCINKDGQWILSIKQKQNILLNNIYGVDIDNQAVEVTQLSLALKMLEDETGGTANQMQVLFHEKILPDLSKNIVCGNSLIGTDILQGKMFPTEEERKLNPMDFETTFSEVFKNGGFDAIVGNPPYIKIQMIQESNPLIPSILKNKYFSAQSGNFDLYILFIERATQLLNKVGVFGYIVPHKFFNSNYGLNIREYLTKSKFLERIIHFEDVQIFENASTYTCLLFLSLRNKTEFEISKIGTNCFVQEYLKNISFSKLPISSWNELDWNIISKEDSYIISKLNTHLKLSEITTNIFQGPKAGADNVFIFKLLERNENVSKCFSKSLNSIFEIENSIVKKYIKSKFIKRYEILYSENEYTMFPYDNFGKLFDKQELQTNFPLAYKYIDNKINKDILCAREDGRFSKLWWAYSRPQNMKILFSNKLLTPFNAFNNSYSIDEIGDFVFSAGVTGAYGILLNAGINISYKYLLGVLNSKICWFFIKNISTALRGGYYSFENKYIKNIPIAIGCSSDFSQSHDKIVSLVDQMLESKKQLQTSKTDKDKTYWERKCEQLDHAIDSEVYKLYGLTEEEIKIIEK